MVASAFTARAATSFSSGHVVRLEQRWDEDPFANCLMTPLARIGQILRGEAPDKCMTSTATSAATSTATSTQPSTPGTPACSICHAQQMSSRPVHAPTTLPPPLSPSARPCASMLGTSVPQNIPLRTPSLRDAERRSLDPLGSDEDDDEDCDGDTSVVGSAPARGAAKHMSRAPDDATAECSWEHDAANRVDPCHPVATALHEAAAESHDIFEFEPEMTSRRVLSYRQRVVPCAVTEGLDQRAEPSEPPEVCFRR